MAILATCVKVSDSCVYIYAYRVHYEMDTLYEAILILDSDTVLIINFHAVVLCEIEDCTDCLEDNVCAMCEDGLSPNEDGTQCVTTDNNTPDIVG